MINTHCEETSKVRSVVRNALQRDGRNEKWNAKYETIVFSLQSV